MNKQRLKCKNNGQKQIQYSVNQIIIAKESTSQIIPYEFAIQLKKESIFINKINSKKQKLNFNLPITKKNNNNKENGFIRINKCETTSNNLKLLPKSKQIYKKPFIKSPIKHINKVRNFESFVNSLNTTQTTITNANNITAKNTPIGLKNLGNTCSVNSIIQCLMHCSPVFQYFLTHKHSKQCNIAPLECGECIFEELSGYYNESQLKGETHFKIISRLLNVVNSEFRIGKQEDAGELFVQLVNAFEKHNQHHSQNQNLKKDANAAANLCKGETIQKIHCLECNSQSFLKENFVDLSLPPGRSVEALLQTHFAKETLIGNNKYHCGKCNSKVTANKQMLIKKFPPLILVQLKRYNNNMIKTNRHIQFPLQIDFHQFQCTSDMAEGIVGSTSSCTKSTPLVNDKAHLLYFLSAFIVHQGHSLKQGHYISFIKNSNNQWFEVDDMQVNKVSDYHVKAQKAYMLFYTKIDNNADENLNLEKQASFENPIETTLDQNDQNQNNISADTDYIIENNSGLIQLNYQEQQNSQHKSTSEDIMTQGQSQDESEKQQYAQLNDTMLINKENKENKSQIFSEEKSEINEITDDFFWKAENNDNKAINDDNKSKYDDTLISESPLNSTPFKIKLISNQSHKGIKIEARSNFSSRQKSPTSSQKKSFKQRTFRPPALVKRSQKFKFNLISKIKVFQRLSSKTKWNSNTSSKVNSKQNSASRSSTKYNSNKSSNSNYKVNSNQSQHRDIDKVCNGNNNIEQVKKKLNFEQNEFFDRNFKLLEVLKQRNCVDLKTIIQPKLQRISKKIIQKPFKLAQTQKNRFKDKQDILKRLTMQQKQKTPFQNVFERVLKGHSWKL